MINSILDPIYDILKTFFPTDLYNQPFFNFLINCFIFAFCCYIFYICFILPIKWLFNYIIGIMHKC